MIRHIPIHISPFFWVLAALIGWINSGTVMGILVWMGVVFISVLVHEYGHALTARGFGQSASIQLTPFGGLTTRNGPSLKPWQEFLIVLNGPLAGFSLFLISSFFLSIYPQNNASVLIYSLEVCMVVNLFWTIFNLLPVMPLDGGQLLKVVLEAWLGFRGLKIAVFLGAILAVVLGLFFFAVQFLIAGVIFLMIAFENFRSWKELSHMIEKDMAPIGYRRIREAEESANRGDVDQAISELSHLRDETKRGVLFVSATWTLSKLFISQGKTLDAYRLLISIREDLTAEQLLVLQKCAYKLQYWEQVLEIGELAYSKSSLQQVAINNALAAAIMGKEEPAIGWLRCSIQSGLANKNELLKMREFDVLRNSKEFQSL